MTVANNTSRNQYTATPSQALFAYTFEIVDKDDIVVLINGIPLSEGTDYTVTGVGSDTGGNIVLTSGTTGGNIVTIYRDMPYARTQNYTNSGDFLASEVNSDFDNLWLASEQTNRSFEQSVRKPITDSDSISMELPQASSRANKLLGFDATGAVSTSLVTGDAQTIAGIAADIETLAHIQDGTVATDAITNVNTIRTDVTAVSGVASDVTAVAGNTANINTVATDLTGADDIGAVAGSITNVNTVAGSIANVNSVAGNATNINTVATDLAGADDIGTVAGSISSVNTVAPDINHVVTVSGDLAGADNIGTVATNISNVNAVGGISSDVTTVAGISTEVTAVSSNSTNINTVGTNITNVNNVGSNIANVNTVAGLETEINAVVADAADIGVVGANITSVNTVSSNINSVNAVYNNMADVNNAAANATAAAASAADANTSAGAAATSANAASTSASNASSSESAALTSANNASQSAATASLSASAAATSATNASSSAANAATSESNADDSETAAAISASNASSSASTASNNAIAAASSATSASNSASQAASSASAAATSATNSETAADTWNSYYSTYLGASATAPSFDLLGQPLQNGALYFNTTNNTMYVFNGSIWIAAESTINIVSVPTQLAADLTTNGNDIIFGDNDKAIFGAGSDLQIYHNGSNSYIDDAGTGSLVIRSNAVNIGKYTGETAAVFTADGSVQLRYDNSAKFETTSTGIDVTGTVVSNGLTLENNAEYLRVKNSSGSSTRAFGVNSANNLYIGGIDADIGPILFVDNGATLATLGPTGLDVTGTVTADGLTVESDTILLDSASSAFMKIDRGNNTSFGITRYYTAGTEDWRLGTLNDGTSDFYLQDSGSAERFKVGTNGDVSLYEDTGTTAKFFWDSSAESLGIGNTDPSSFGAFRVTQTSADSGGGIAVETGTVSARLYVDGSGIRHLTAGTTDVINWDASGNVGIGTSSPSYKLSLEQASPTLQLKTTNTTGTNTILFSDSASNFVGNIKYDHSTNALSFATSTTSSERMRIDSSGNLLVGTTTLAPATAGNTSGAHIYPSGQGQFSQVSAASGVFNRKTTDGTILDFRKDGSTVGGIGTAGGTLDIGSGDTTLRFSSSLDAIYTVASVGGGGRDGAVNLGISSNRFKDLYLSGGAYIGGVAAANKLDDYEEGTWTPVVADAASGGNTATVGTVTGSYIKIGSQVHVVCSLTNINKTGLTASNTMYVRGLPFTTANGTVFRSVGTVRHDSVNAGTDAMGVVAHTASNSTVFTFAISRNNTTDIGLVVSMLHPTNSDFVVSLSYQAA